MYFVGYVIGGMFLFLPDLLGRKGCMMVILPLYSIAAALVVFPDDLQLKKLGYFLQGLFHIKISNSFTHMYEIMPEASKAFA